MNDLTGARAAQAEIARRVLKTLAERRLIPTPETFAAVYEELSGTKSAGVTPLAVIKDVVRDLVRGQRLSSADAQAVLQAAQGHDWKAVRDAIDKALARRPGGAGGGWPQLALTLLKQADQLHANWTRARKLEAVARVVEAAGDQPDLALERLSRLLESWGPALAALPAREELLARLLGLPQAPAQRLVSLLSAPARQLAVALNQGVKENKFTQENPPDETPAG